MFTKLTDTSQATIYPVLVLVMATGVALWIRFLELAPNMIYTGSVWPASLAHAVHNAAWGALGAFTATTYPVIVNKYLVGDYGILIFVGAAIGAIWLNRRLMKDDPDEPRSHIAGGEAPAT